MGRFQSTRPVRGATRLDITPDVVTAFQSTRPVRGATNNVEWLGNVISVSIHAPRAGRDLCDRFDALSPRKFQSTRPVRGATRKLRKERNLTQFQSTRPVRGATA